MKSILSCLAAVSVQARRRLGDAKGKQVAMPVVRDCEAACVFGSQEVTGDREVNDYWCFEFTTPHVEIGWEFE
jgi:hypothetical protein